MKGEFRIVTYYTEDTPYQKEASRLVESCLRWGYSVTSIGLPSTGDWIRNCNQKPRVIWEEMQRDPRTPLLWLDADAFVMRPLDLLKEMGAVAVYRHEGLEVASGTVFLRPSYSCVRRLVKSWMERAESQAKWPDQPILGKLLREQKPPTTWLPQSYCKIYWARDFDGTSGFPAILQKQLSRKVRAEIDSGR